MSYLKLRVLNAEVVPVTSDIAAGVVLSSPDCGFIVVPLREGLSGFANHGELASLSRGDLLIVSGKRTGRIAATANFIVATPAADFSVKAGLHAGADSRLRNSETITVDQLLHDNETLGRTYEATLAIILKIQLCEIMKGGIGDTLPDYLLLTPDTDKRSNVLSIAEQLAKISDNSNDINKAKVLRFTELLLIDALELFLARDSKTSPLLRGGDDLRIGDAIKAVHEKPEHNWTVSRLATIANMSRSLFAVRFREACGETPLNYVRQCRIHRAKLLLTESIAPLDQIAAQCGYSSQSAFIKAFSTAIGYSPGRWRTMQKNQPHESSV